MDVNEHALDQSTGAFLYYYVPGQAVDRTGGGVIIPLPSSVGQ